MQVATELPERPRITKPVVVLALDPGLTTGWALVRAHDQKVLATGTATPEDLGEVLDEHVRAVHREGCRVRAVVEQPPTGRTYHGDALDVVQRTIAHWLQGVFGLVPAFVAPGEWKPSRVARAYTAARGLSMHERDAIRMALYWIERERP